jgi:hypothetical protein
MSKLIHIDQDYKQWILSISKRFRRSQIKAAVHINQDMLSFYWSLGKEIVELHSEQRWGNKFFANLSHDLKEANPGAGCFSETNLLYMKNFYLLYSPLLQITPQTGEQIAITPQLGEEATSQPLGISEYEQQKLYPTKVEGTIPTIAEIESVAQDTVVKPEDNEENEQ